MEDDEVEDDEMNTIAQEVSGKCARRISEVRYAIRDDKEFETYVESEVYLAISSKDWLVATRGKPFRVRVRVRVLFLGAMFGLALMFGMMLLLKVAPELCAAIIMLIAAWRMANWGFDLSRWVFSLSKED